MILVSIVTPTFNNVEKLKININGVKQQSFKCIEHIIVDNLSSDGTEQLINAYKNGSGYPVVYIREKDTGIYNAMNKGIKSARGEWVHILNSDDYYFSENSLECLFRDDCSSFDVIINSILLKNEKTGVVVSKWTPEYNNRINHYNFPHSGMVIKKTFYETHGYYNEKYRILSDSMFCMRFLPFAKYKIIEEPLVVMLDSGVSNKFSFTKSKELLVFNLFYYKGPLKFRLKFLFINLILEIKSVLKIIFRKH